MAIKNAASLRKRTYNGTTGNASFADGTATFSGDAADTEVRVLNMTAGMKLYRLSAYSAPLGAGTSIEVGVHYPKGDGTDDPDAFGTIADTSTADSLTWEQAPVRFDTDVQLTVTVKGAAGTGDVDIVAEYVAEGEL